MRRVSLSKQIGRKIQEIRNEKGLTQEEVAARQKCCRSLVSAIEVGRRNLDAQDLPLWAKTLDISLVELLFRIFNVPESQGDAALLSSRKRS